MRVFCIIFAFLTSVSISAQDPFNHYPGIEFNEWTKYNSYDDFGDKNGEYFVYHTMSKECCNYIYVVDRPNKMAVYSYDEKEIPLIPLYEYGDVTIKVKYSDGSILSFDGFLMTGSINFMNHKNYYEFPQMLSLTNQKVWKVAVYARERLIFSFDLKPRR